MSPETVPQRAARIIDERTAPARTRLALSRLARTRQPIVVGPWAGEIGFELLYWIPFLTAFLERHGIDRGRVTAVSRGGAQPWYEHLAARYVDLLDHLSEDELREWHELRVATRATQKQVRPDRFDALFAERASAELPTGAAVLHPSLLYTALRSYWEPLIGERRQTLDQALSRLRFRSLAAAAGQARGHDALAALPPAFVAVKAYFSQPLPETEANRHFLRELLARLTATTDVVLLASGADIDDHVDYGQRGERIHSLGPMSPRDNLAVQTAAIAGADMLVCTYGGFAYLGPLVGVPTVAFYSLDNAKPWHLDVARRMTQTLGGDAPATLLSLHVEELDTLDVLAGGGAGSVRS